MIAGGIVYMKNSHYSSVDLTDLHDRLISMQRNIAQELHEMNS